METKVCTKCNRELLIEMFSKDKSTKDGLQYICKECRKQINKQYYEKNREKINERTSKYYQENIDYYKKWHKENKEHLKEYRLHWNKDNPDKFEAQRKRHNKRYYWKHRDKRLIRIREWIDDNRMKVNETQSRYLKTNKGKESERRRQCRRRAIEGYYTLKQWNECLEFFDNNCAYTGESLDNTNCHIEHIIPISKGGSSYIWNLCPSIDYANMSKHNYDLEDWYRKQPYFSEERLNRLYEWVKYAKEKYSDFEK